ncbi:MAG: RecB-like helicase [Epsilonproteobacteria bacterium]|nr:RecB-like helicase [Campylobacterota bacterium]
MFISYLAYEASAGSGKTFALSIRYISLLFLGANPQNILTLTFTNKAANEMQERIFAILRELHLPKREAELKELCKILEKTPKDILKRQPEILEIFLNSDIKISTIDKFFSQILRKFSFYANLLPDFEIDEDNDDTLKAELFVKEVVKRGEYEKLINFILLLQKRFEDIFNLFARFYEKDHEIEDVLSFLSEREFVDPKIVMLFVKEIENIFLECRDLSNSAKKAFLIEDHKALAESTWFCKDSLKDYRFFKKCYKEEADEYFHSLKESMKKFFEYREFRALRDLFDLYLFYKKSNQDAAVELNRLTFTDVTNFVYELLARNVDREFLYFRLDSRIDHILLDEFQDTSIVQYKILEPLIEEICSGEGVRAKRSFFYVGDTKQSIYRFRGGAKELFYYLANRFDIKLDKLDTNYRSRAKIVEFVNSVFENLLPNYSRQFSADKEDGGYVEVKESEETIEAILDSVKELKDKGVKDSDIAILTYKNSDSFDIEEALKERFPDIKITTETTSLLINQPRVRAVIEMLIYLYFQSPYNKANFLALIGKDINEDISKEIEGLDISKSLPSLIKDIIKTFSLYDKDPNLLRLIEISFGYEDIESFIFNFESISAKSLSKNEEGIKILTIHKSKGLEFPHLIVSDRLSKKRTSGEAFIFSYEGIDLKNIFYRQKGRECVDEEYKRALEREKKLMEEDELNAQYVAFTRAKNSLIICKNAKNSSFERFSLKPFKEGEIEVWDEEKIAKEKQDALYAPYCLSWKKREENGEKAVEDPDSTVFGISLHYLLEMMEEFDSDSFKEAFLAMKNRYGYLLEAKEIEDIERRVKRVLDNSSFLNLVNGKRRKEQAVSYGNKLYRIDLLVERDDDWIVIDYKTSESPRSEHKEQMNIYKNIIAKIVKKPVKGYLLYLKEEDIELLEI